MLKILMLFGCSNSTQTDVWTSESGPWRTAQVRSEFVAAGQDRTTLGGSWVPAKITHRLVLSNGTLEGGVHLGSANDGAQDWEAVKAQTWRGVFAPDGARMALSPDGSRWRVLHFEPSLFYCSHVFFPSSDAAWGAGADPRTVALDVLVGSTHQGHPSGRHSTFQWDGSNKTSGAQRGQASQFLGEFKSAMAWAGTQVGDAEVRLAVVKALATPGVQLEGTDVVAVGTAMVVHGDFAEALKPLLDGPHPKLVLQILAHAPGFGPNTVKALAGVLDRKGMKYLPELTWSVAKRLESGEDLPEAAAVLQRIARLDPHEGRDTRRAIRLAVQGLFHSGGALDALAGGTCEVFKVDVKADTLRPDPNNYALSGWSSEVGEMDRWGSFPGFHSVACQAAAAKKARP